MSGIQTESADRKTLCNRWRLNSETRAKQPKNAYLAPVCLRNVMARQPRWATSTRQSGCRAVQVNLHAAPSYVDLSEVYVHMTAQFVSHTLRIAFCRSARRISVCVCFLNDARNRS